MKLKIILLYNSSLCVISFPICKFVITFQVKNEPQRQLFIKYRTSLKNLRMKKYYILLLTTTGILFTACSPRLTGTWNIARYENKQPGQQALSMENIGTITFRKNGDGEKNINYSIFGKSTTDNSRFGWYSTGPYVGIESPGSDLSKTWIIITNKRREQKWKSTDGGNVQILELKR